MSRSWFDGANPFGGRSETWQGIDLNFSARLEGLLLQGGYAAGQQSTDRCGLEESLPETINSGAQRGASIVALEYCSYSTPWISQASLYGVYTLPYDIEIAAAYGDRLNQVDLRIARVIGFGGSGNLRASLDIHNLFNANAVARERYGLVNYLQPVGLQPGRLAKLSFQLNF